MSVVISIVIPTYNRKNLLERCLDSLFYQNYPKDKYEIIVVDDGSCDETSTYLSFLSKSFENLKYIRQDNSGHSVARKAGFLKAKGEIIASLDDDCIPCEGWISTIVDEFENHPNLSICCGKILNPTDTKYAWAQHLIDFSLWIGSRTKKNIKLAPTANTAYRREVIKEEKSYDDAKYLGYRDILFNHEIIKKGYKTTYCPEMKVVHMRWDKKYNQSSDSKALFINGQIRHGKGFRSGGHKVYGASGAVFFKLPPTCYIFVKAIIILFRSLHTGFFTKYIWSFRWILLGLYYQAFAFKKENYK